MSTGARSIFRYLQDSGGSDINAVAKTATFNSETLSLGYCDYFGLLIDVNTVSGTSPTLDIKCQVSPDNGTTWLDLYPNAEKVESTATDTTNQFIFAQITAAKETMQMVPVWFHSAKKVARGGGTLRPVARFVFTIGGSSPSFTMNVFLVARKFSTE